MDTDTGGYLKSLFGLKGKRALVTGASSGLGAASAAALVAAGADVVVSGRDAERTQAVADAVGGSAEVADLLEPRAAEQLASRALEGGSVDILVNAAGIFERDTGEQISQESWDRVLFLNTTVTFVLCQAIGRQMIERGGGKIVNFASTDGMVGVPEQSAYCASKGAVVQLTRTLGAEWIKHGVNVNAVGPCDFDTPMIAEALGEPEYRAWILDAIPAGRVGKPDEIVGAVLYLASPASDMVVGHTLMVDGGRIAI
jgi:NAD(P)-dependent dehydrogenase (short-subunit alcohol dehydrogenase family)